MNMLDHALESPACDLCGASDAIGLYTHRDWPGDVPDGIAMVRCARCGLMYLRPRPTPAAIGRYYPPDYAPFRRAVEDERWAVLRWLRRRKLAQRRALVERFAPAGRRAVLDVGCSTGLFLHEMASAGWEARGVELAPSAARYARERFGLDVFEGRLEDAPLAAGAFGAVTFWDVLEHVHSPSEALARAAALLAPGGIVVVNVPNWDSPDRRLFGPHWQGWDPPRHLFVFDRATLAALLRRAGLAPLAWRCIMPSYFTFILSVERWLRATAPRAAGPTMRVLGLPGLRFAFEPVFWALNRIGRGSVIAVVARKEAGEA